LHDNQFDEHDSNGTPIANVPWRQEEKDLMMDELFVKLGLLATLFCMIMAFWYAAHADYRGLREPVRNTATRLQNRDRKKPRQRYATALLSHLLTAKLKGSKRSCSLATK
jgi:hypothetical protein